MNKNKKGQQTIENWGALGGGLVQSIPGGNEKRKVVIIIHVQYASKKVSIPSKINAVETLPLFKNNAPATV